MTSRSGPERPWLRIIVVTMLPALAHAQSSDASRGVQLGFEIDEGLLASGSNPSPTGTALSLHGGYRFRNGVTPELRLARASWTWNPITDETALAIMPGVRWGLGTDPLFAAISAHAGYGLLLLHPGDSRVGWQGLALDLGLDLGVQFGGTLMIGLHLGVEGVIRQSEYADEFGQEKVFFGEAGDLWFDIGFGISVNL